jgi:transcriptional regulator with XRE-family HTH domain
MIGAMNSVPPVGGLLREWRKRRRMSQLGFALDAEISSRHLSFIETGRAQPSREMVLHLSRQVEITADKVLIDLLNELTGYPAQRMTRPLPPPDRDLAGVVVPFQLVTDGGILSFLSTTTIFGTPVDITLSELALESFFPATGARNLHGGLRDAAARFARADHRGA